MLQYEGESCERGREGGRERGKKGRRYESMSERDTPGVEEAGEFRKGDEDGDLVDFCTGM